MSYLAEVMADSPYHFWRCADPGGNYLHDIGSSPKVLVSGTGSRALPYSGPVVGGGSYLNVNDQFWNFDADTLGAPITTELWFWQTYRNGATQRLLDLINAGGITLGTLQLDGSGKPGGFGPSNSIVSATPLSTNAWHHLAYSTPAVGTSILVADGVQLGTGGAAGASTIAAQVAVGSALPSATLRFLGSIAEVAIYRSALSLARVQAHYAAADNTLGRPIFKAFGTWDITTGLGTLAPADVDLILSSVRRSYT